jgi:L-fucose mutarotase
MLKGIPREISPDLLKVLSEMGHGDEIVIGDGNFQGASLAGNILLRNEGVDAATLLEAILKVFPLDTDIKTPVMVMKPDKKEFGDPLIWARYKKVVEEQAGIEFTEFRELERYDFYERSRNAYAIVTTHERELFANIIIKKGVVL